MKKNKLISDIHSILINDWDPIGIGDNSNLNDEYDDYIGSIIEFLIRKPSIEMIVAFLRKIEKTEFGIDNIDVKKLYDIAAKLKMIEGTVL